MAVDMIGKGIAMAGLCIATAWLEVSGQPTGGLWVLIVIWIIIAEWK